MQQADRQLIRFALIICLSCSIILSAVAAGLRERQERQMELDRKRNVLVAFGQDIRDPQTGRRLAAEAVEAIFNGNIREIVFDAATGERIPDDQVNPQALQARRQLPLFYWEEDGRPVRFALPTSGPGLWAPIFGFLALESDLETIAGITFYRHGETPGLGGEIEREWFQRQFVGQRLMADGEPIQFQVVQEGVSSRYPDGNPHAVDGISGATMTGRAVAAFISEDFKTYNRFFQRLRESGLETI